MSDPSTNGALKLRVEDFGPIARAEVDLRPLTVFVGPSNTGKSYLAILIYALHRFFGGNAGFGRPIHRPAYSLFGTLDGQDLSQDVVEALMETLRATGKTNRFILPSKLTAAIRSEHGKRGPLFGTEVTRCFGVDAPGTLIRMGQNRADISVRPQNSNGQDSWSFRFDFRPRRSEFHAMFSEHFAFPIHDARDLKSMTDAVAEYGYHLKNHTDDQNEGLDIEFSFWNLISTLDTILLPNVVGPLRFPAYYLPADRTGIMHAHSVVVSALIERAPTAGLRPTTTTPVLSGVLADFLGRLIQIDRSHRLTGDPRSLDKRAASKIEEDILGGSVSVDRSSPIDYPHFTYRPESWKRALPLMNASSMVSEIAPVVLYLRYVVRPGDVLIVEEPESHLHPAMQVKFVRQLAALVHAGVRIIVTTHSEWVMEELANTVYRSELPRSEDGIHADNGRVALDPEQVGAWLFQQEEESGGTVVREMELDQEVRLYPTDFDRVSEALYNESARIYNRLDEEKAG